MTPSIRMVETTHTELANLVETFTRAAYAVAAQPRDGIAGDVPGSILTWETGILRRGDLVVEHGEEQSLVRIVETGAGSIRQLEMAWPTHRLPNDAAGTRDLVRRVVSMAMLVAMEQRDPAADPEHADHVAAEMALRAEAETVNDITGAYQGGTMEVVAATPWTSALVRLTDSEHELQSTDEMVVVTRTTTQSVETISIMPHLASIGIPDHSTAG
jgi:hypothetical protein